MYYNKIAGQRKVAIVLDDHNLFAESFSKILEDLGYFSSVTYFSSTDALQSFILQVKHSDNIYFFLDYFLKDKTILSTINYLKRLCKNPKITIVSGSEALETIRNLIDYNVDAILHKSSSIQEVHICLNSLFNNKKYYSSDILTKVESIKNIQEEPKLSKRELEILEYFSKGISVDATAQLMFISRHTVAAHRRKMFLKTGSNTITELINYARKNDLI